MALLMPRFYEHGVHAPKECILMAGLLNEFWPRTDFLGFTISPDNQWINAFLRIVQTKSLTIGK